MLHNNEAEFMDTMRPCATELAKLQLPLDKERTALVEFLGHNKASSLDHAVTTDLVEVLSSQKLSASVQYFVGVYTALTLFRAPETWSPQHKEGKRLQQALVEALDFLSSRQGVLEFEIEFGHDVVKQMRQ